MPKRLKVLLTLFFFIVSFIFSSLSFQNETKVEAVSFSVEELKEVLTGKSFSGASSFLQSQENISGFEIEIKPAIFRLFKFMPFNRSRIDITVNSQGNTTTEPDNSEKTNDEGSNKNAE